MEWLQLIVYSNTVCTYVCTYVVLQVTLMPSDVHDVYTHYWKKTLTTSYWPECHPPYF